MRIDLNPAALNQLPAEQNVTQVKSTQPGAGTVAAQLEAALSTTAPARVHAPVQSEDTATLSPQSLALSSLTAAALKTPPTRQDKVDAISQALHSGAYEVNPSKIADAIVADRVG